MNVRCAVRKVDAGMKLSLWLAGALLVTTCALAFVLVLDAETSRDDSLAVLNAFVAYPILAYTVFSICKVLRCGGDALFSV